MRSELDLSVALDELHHRWAVEARCLLDDLLVLVLE